MNEKLTLFLKQFKGLINMKNFLMLIYIIICSSSLVQSQNTDSLMKSGRELLETGSTYFDQVSLIQAEEKFQEVLDIDGSNYLAQYLLAYTDYRLAVYYLEDKDIEHFNNYISICENELNSLLDSNDTDVEALSLLSSAYGEQIRQKPETAEALAPKALELMKEADKIDPENPRVQFLTGKLLLTLPKKFGGDKNKSLIHLQKAIKLFEEGNEADDEIGWGYIFALTWLGINYSEINDYQSAIDTYNKALEVDPDFVWINNTLLPGVSAKLNKGE